MDNAFPILSFYDFLFGIVGFAGFELIRIYKKISADKRQELYNHGVLSVTVVIVLLATFSGLVAGIFEADSSAKSLFVGFSVPSGFKTLMAKNKIDGVVVEDISTSQISQFEYFKHTFSKYFDF